MEQGRGAHRAFFDADPQRMDLGRLLARAGHALGGLHRRAAAVHGLTPTSLGVLGHLADGRAVSHRELAVALGVAPATLTPVLDALESRGEVTRARDADDRRVVRVSITGSGGALLASSYGSVARVVAAQVPLPSPGEEAVIRGYLVALLGAVDGDPVGES